MKKNLMKNRFMKIFLADPHPHVRSALRLVLSQIREVAVIGEAGDVSQLLARNYQECPDLILLDPELVKLNRSHQRDDSQQLAGIIAETHKIYPEAKVVAISSRLEVEREALAAGADGFISETEPPEIFCEKIAGIRIKEERRSSK